MPFAPLTCVLTGAYDRVAVEKARQAVLERLEAKASLLGVELGKDSLPSQDLDRSLMGLTQRRKEEGLVNAEAIRLKKTLDSMLGVSGGGVPEEGDGSEDRAEDPPNALESLQRVLAQYMDAIHDSSKEVGGRVMICQGWGHRGGDGRTRAGVLTEQCLCGGARWWSSPPRTS